MASQSKANLSIENISLEQVKKGYFPSFAAAFESNFPVLISTNLNVQRPVGVKKGVYKYHCPHEITSEECGI